MEKQLLKVGQKIYVRNYGILAYVGEIDRTTKKYAFVGDRKFKIDYTDKYIDTFPRRHFSNAIYFIPDENDIIELKKQQLIRFVTKFDYSKLSLDKMVDIKDIINRKE